VDHEDRAAPHGKSRQGAGLFAVVMSMQIGAERPPRQFANQG
jgi:hypothetical protein